MLKPNFFDLIDRFEMHRQIKKINKISNQFSENDFSPVCCKSHLNGHGRRITQEFNFKNETIKKIIN